MAPMCAGVNKPGRAMTLRFVFCVLVCCFCTVTDVVRASNDSFTTKFNDTSCTRHFNLSAGDSPKPLTPDLVQLGGNRTSITYDVKACSDVEVILYAIALQPQPQASVIHIVLGRNNESKSSIEHHGSPPDEEPENPLRCGEFRRFAISWDERRVMVFKHENGTWQKFLLYPSTKPMEMDVYSVFVGYKLNAAQDDSSRSEWQLDVPCKDSDEEESPDTSSMVSRGHLAAAVITALIVGLLLGAFCVIYVPKGLKYVRERKRTRGRDTTRDGAPTEEELTTLVAVQTPDKPQGPARLAAETPEVAKTDLSLPGDNPSPATGPSAKRKPIANTYTPYHEMGGPAAATPAPAPAPAPAPKKAHVPRKTSDVSRKTSGAGRVAASPLPALPGDDVGTTEGATSESDDVYVNAEAHIYSGMQHEAPIYENRNTGVYEDLNAPVAKK